MNPSSNLSDLSGQGKSSVEYEYYKKQYNIVIKDPNQPMLIGLYKKESVS